MYNVAFFASGTGTNFEAIAQKVKEGSLLVSMEFVLSNNSGSGVMKKALDYDVKTYHVSEKNQGSLENVENKMLELIDYHKLDLIILAGYMKKVPEAVIKKMSDRICNVHPALLPAFGGGGWYGSKIHWGVIDKMCQYSGVTFHISTEIYDEGKIIFQKILELDVDETPVTLEEKIHKIEYEYYWQVVKGFATGVLIPGIDNLQGLKGVREFRQKMLNK